ncbi:MAG: Spy/CpxP family protein refolding chaperone [Leptolyngbyaceae bacterium]|nr:Spy/CpxP family protein refolding chaperone [Leptolyngbyaceae bacterium]
MLRSTPILVALMLCLGCASALAEPNTFQSETLLAQRQQRRPRQQQEGFLKELNLTPEQTKKMQEIRNQSKTQISERRQAVQQAQEELRSLMSGTAPRSQIQDKFRQVQALRQQAAELQFNNLLEMREVLTPEQRRKFAEAMENRRSNWGNRPKRAQSWQGQMGPMGMPE